MWNKLCVLLSTAGITSITLYKAIDSLCWASPQPRAAGSSRGDTLGGPGHTFQKHNSTTSPGGCCSHRNHTGLKDGLYVGFIF